MRQAVCILVHDPAARSRWFLNVGRPRAKFQFGMPGGKVEVGETLEQAAIRELYEETRIRAQVTDIYPIFSGADGNHFHVSTFVLIPEATPDPRTIPSINDEGLPLRWFNESMMCDPRLSRFAEYNSRLFQALRERQQLLEALEGTINQEHVGGCQDNTCTISEAATLGCFLYAADMLQRATEAPETERLLAQIRPSAAELEYEHRILLASPHFTCTKCNSVIWRPDTEEVRCGDCGQLHLPGGST